MKACDEVMGIVQMKPEIGVKKYKEGPKTSEKFCHFTSWPRLKLSTVTHAPTKPSLVSAISLFFFCKNSKDH